MDYEKIIRQIEEQWEILLNCRSVFPYVTQSHIGEKSLTTAPYYSVRGYNLRFQFSEPLTKGRVEQLVEIGYWINQSYVIRLCVTLEVNQITQKIDEGIPGHKKVEILEALRNKFAHSPGRYNPRKPKNRKLYATVVDHFSLDEEEYSGDPGSFYPIPIDSVLEPLTKGCVRYIKGLQAKVENRHREGADTYGGGVSAG